MIEILMAAALAITPPVLKDYLRDPIGLYDASGDLIRKTPKKTLPKPPVHVDSNGDYVSFEVAGQRVYLRNSDVLVDGLPPHCADLPKIAQSATGHVAASDIGVRSGMGSASVQCIPDSR